LNPQKETNGVLTKKGHGFCKGGLMKNKKIALIVVGGLVLLLLGGLCGWAVASNQKVKGYPFLSDSYNAEHIPIFAQWMELEFTAVHNHESYLTDKLVRTDCVAYLLEDRLSICVDTRTQPGWDVYLGEGRFSVSDRELRAAYTEATNRILKDIRIYFPEKESGLSDQEIEIAFAIYGSEVGVWKGGVFKLEGEE